MRSNCSQLLSRYNQSAHRARVATQHCVNCGSFYPNPSWRAVGVGTRPLHHPPALASVGARGGGPPIASDCLPAALASRDANPQAARGLAGTAAPGSGGFGCAGWAAPPGVDLGRRPARPPGMPRCWPLPAGSIRTWPWGIAEIRRSPELQLRWVSTRGGRLVAGGGKAV